MDEYNIVAKVPKAHKVVGYGLGTCDVCHQVRFLHGFVLAVKVGLPAIVQVHHRWLCKRCAKRVRVEFLAAKFQRQFQRQSTPKTS